MNKCEQVEQVLTDAHRCSNVGTTDLEQVVLSLDAKRVSRLLMPTTLRWRNLALRRMATSQPGGRTSAKTVVGQRGLVGLPLNG